ncbi:MAG: tryptophan--tRNA ligase [Geminicoccaceae bacterium]
MQGRIFSGVQPTGNLHLGNYLGAIRNWVDLQQDFECIYCIVDMHAITLPQDPAGLRQATREVAAAYIASGIDPERCTIFVQSNVSGHAELAWIFNCITPLGWLNRMTQFKDKAGKKRDLAAAGLFVYPVLMAADILLYKGTHVPVGEDQKQHLELARDIAGAFNRAYDTEFFPLPEPLILGEATRIMSLRDGTKKMSKSDSSDYSRINLSDDADTIAAKIRKAKSDMVVGLRYDPDNRPEAANLLTIFAALERTAVKEVEARYAEAQFSQFKSDLAELAVAKLSPITAEMRRMLADPEHIDGILRRGAERAAAIAEDNLRQIQDIVGLLRP